MLYRNGLKFYSNSASLWNPVLLCALHFMWKMLCFFCPAHNCNLIHKMSVTIGLGQEAIRYEVFYYWRNILMKGGILSHKKLP